MKKLFYYMNSVFKMNKEVNSLTDKRRNNSSIKFKTVIITALVGLILQQPSFNAIFTHISFRRRTANLFVKGTKMAKLDAARAIIEMVDLDEIRSMNEQVVETIRRNKVFRGGTIDGLVVAGIDGVELFNSYDKCCEECLERVHNKGKENEKIEYFHRSVVCMTVGDDPHIILGEDMLHPRDGSDKDEGELTGAKRLVDNLYKRHHHFADVMVGDALYLNAPFINTVTDKGIDVVIRSKDPNRVIMRDALGLIKGKKSSVSFKDKKAKVKVEAWDVKGFEMEGAEKTLRFLQFKETWKKNKRRHVKDGNGRKTGKTELVETIETRTVWVFTTLENASAKTIWRIIHKRWDIENNGFRQLKTFYHADHCFDHKAVENVFLLNILAFNLREMFLFRRLRKFRDSNRTRIDITSEWSDDLLLYSFHEYFELDTG